MGDEKKRLELKLGFRVGFGSEIYRMIDKGRVKARIRIWVEVRVKAMFVFLKFNTQGSCRVLKSLIFSSVF